MSQRLNVRVPQLDKPAPDFTLNNQDGVPVKASEIWQAHPLILVFYPGDETPGCTMQLCAIRDEWSALERQGVAVLGINHGSSVSHQHFQHKAALPFPLLVDTDKQISRAYGAVWQLFNVTVIRRTVVGINTKGIIRFYKHGMPKAAEVLKHL